MSIYAGELKDYEFQFAENAVGKKLLNFPLRNFEGRPVLLVNIPPVEELTEADLPFLGELKNLRVRAAPRKDHSQRGVVVRPSQRFSVKTGLFSALANSKASPGPNPPPRRFSADRGPRSGAAGGVDPSVPGLNQGNGSDGEGPRVFKLKSKGRRTAAIESEAKSSSENKEGEDEKQEDDVKTELAPRKAKTKAKTVFLGNGEKRGPTLSPGTSPTKVAGRKAGKAKTVVAGRAKAKTVAKPKGGVTPTGAIVPAEGIHSMGWRRDDSSEGNLSVRSNKSNASIRSSKSIGRKSGGNKSPVAHALSDAGQIAVIVVPSACFHSYWRERAHRVAYHIEDTVAQLLNVPHIYVSKLLSIRGKACDPFMDVLKHAATDQAGGKFLCSKCAWLGKAEVKAPFTKFLIDKGGEIVGRFPPGMSMAQIRSKPAWRKTIHHSGD